MPYRMVQYVESMVTRIKYNKQKKHFFQENFSHSNFCTGS